MPAKRVVAALAAAGLSTVTQAAAAEPAGAIARFEIEKRISPAFDGARFGKAGQYELIVGRAYGALDPAAAANARIRDLDKAPRNATGRVEYRTQVAILRPIDTARASGKLVFEIINRSNSSIDLDGRAVTAPMNIAATFLARGDTLVAAAWQGEVRADAAFDFIRAGARMAFGGSPLYAELPPVIEAGKPLVRRTHQNASRDDVPLAADPATIALVYPAANDRVEVWSRRHEADTPLRVRAARIHLLDRSTVRVDPAPGESLYDVVYDATGAVVSGIGFAIPRDLVAFLRHDPGDGKARVNPLASGGRVPISHAYAYGLSQSGRYLRSFLWEGFNQDTRGGRVFDGVLIVIAGGKRGSFNGAFATPGVTSRPHAEHRTPDNFPFAYPTLHDPISGRSDGLLARCTATGTCPKVIQLDTENELLNGYGYMMTTTPEGRAIERQPDDVRLYAVAGGDHSAGGGPRAGFPYCRPKQLFTTPLMPFVRAAMSLLDRWASDGVAPPPSRFPSLADGTLVSLDAARRAWPDVPGAPYDMSRDVPEHWVDALPIPLSKGIYPVLTVKGDADGNAVAGILHPMMAVPTATIVGHTGRTAGNAPEDSCAMQGESLPFAATRAERARSGDPRPSLAERYPGGVEELRARRREVAAQLVADRLLLPEEAEAAADGGFDEARARP